MAQNTPEFSYPVDVSRVSSSPMKLELRADEEQRRALAARFKIVSVDTLTAEVELKRVNRSQIRVRGSFEADVTQTCVVSLEPFCETVSDSFSVLFGENQAARPNEHEIELNMDEDEETDVAQDGKIDAGELVSEYLALSLDPFPRRPGASFSYETTAEEKKSPFAALEKLKLK